jgi:hypothetical protein
MMRNDQGDTMPISGKARLATMSPKPVLRMTLERKEQSTSQMTLPLTEMNLCLYGFDCPSMVSDASTIEVDIPDSDSEDEVDAPETCLEGSPAWR